MARDLKEIMEDINETEKRIQDLASTKQRESDQLKSFLESAFFVAIILLAAIGAIAAFAFVIELDITHPWREQLVFIAMKQSPGQKENGEPETKEILVFRSLKTGNVVCYSNDGWKTYPAGEYVESKSMTWDLNRREDEGRNYRQLEYPDFVGQWKPEELRKIIEGANP